MLQNEQKQCQIFQFRLLSIFISQVQINQLIILLINMEDEKEKGTNGQSYDKKYAEMMGRKCTICFSCGRKILTKKVCVKANLSINQRINHIKDETNINNKLNMICFIRFLQQTQRKNRLKELKKKVYDKKIENQKLFSEKQISNKHISLISDRIDRFKDIVTFARLEIQSKEKFLSSILSKSEQKKAKLNNTKLSIIQDIDILHQLTASNTCLLLNNIKILRTQLPAYTFQDQEQKIIYERLNYTEKVAGEQNKINWGLIMLMMRVKIIGDIMGFFLPYEVQTVHESKLRIGFKSFRIDEEFQNLVNEIGGFVQVNIDCILAKGGKERKGLLRLEQEDVVKIAKDEKGSFNSNKITTSYLIQSKLQRIFEDKLFSFKADKTNELFTDDYRMARGKFKVIEQFMNEDS